MLSKTSLKWYKDLEILGVDNQMSTSFGQDEPHRSPNSNCAIGIYFMSFLYEHPVFSISIRSIFLQNDYP